MLESPSGTQLQSLPPEILDNIFQYLSFYDRWHICSVSSSWRSMMLHWIGMFETISTDEYKKGDLASILLPYRSYINGTVVKHIQINVQKSEDLLSMINFLIDNKCNRITKINVTTIRWEKYSFLRMVAHCAEMLTELSLTFNCSNDNHYKPPPELVLRHFPKLESLFYAGPIHCISQWKPSFPTYFKHYNLCDLELHVRNSDGTFEAKNILAVTPHIRRLKLGLQSIEKTSPSIFLEILQQCCPKLVTLAIQHMYGSATIIDPELLSIKQKRHANCGLENLVFHDPFDKYQSAQTLIRLLITKYHQSLHNVYINCAYMHYDQDSLSRTGQPDTFILPNLQHLSLIDRIRNMSRRHDNDRLHPLSRLITNSTTNLRHLSLTYLEGNMELGLFASGANQIRKIHLNHCNAINSHQLATLFRDLGMKKKLHLTHIILQSMQHISSEVLHSIASIARRSCLKELVIDHCDNLSLEQIELFLDNIKTNNNYEPTINKINASLIYQGSITPYSLNQNKIQQILHKFDAQALEWKLSLTSYTDVSVHLESYDCLQYRERKRKQHQAKHNPFL